MQHQAGFYEKYVKRLLDIVLSGLALIVLSPLLLVTIQQVKLCDKRNAVFFGLNMDCAITDLNQSAWSVHKVNVFEAFKEAGIPGMPMPV